MDSIEHPALGDVSWRLAPVMLVFFIASALYLTPGDPALVPIASLGFGYTVGWALRMHGRSRLAVIGFYFAVLAILGLLFDRDPVVNALASVGLAMSVWVLVVLGDRVGLERMVQPSDAFKLMLIAGVSGILMPLLAVTNATIAGLQGELPRVMPQTILTGVAGILLASSLPLTYERGAFVVHGRRRQAELFALAAVMLFLLLGITLMDSDTIAGSGPLFLLVLALGWLSMRFTPALASAGVVTAGIWVAIGVEQGKGAFVSTTSTFLDAELAAQIYICVLAAGVLMLSVYARYKRDHDAAAIRTSDILSSAADEAATEVFIKHYDTVMNQFTYAEVNDIFAQNVGLTPAEVVGLTDADLFNADAAAAFHAQDMQIYSTGQRARFETVVSARGRRYAFYASKFPVRDANGTIFGVGGVSLDRTEERRRAAMLQLVFARSPVPTARLRWDGDDLGEVLEVNDAFASLLAVDPEQIVGHRLDHFAMGATELLTSDGGRTQRREVRLRRRDGSELTVVATTTTVNEAVDEQFALVILEDVTATRAAEAGLVHRATHDPLTDLLNRQALVERLASRAVASGAVPAGITVWCCDLDGFKQFNDSLGHDTGDRVLLEVAQRVRAAVAPENVVGRLGADEFVVVSDAPLDVDTALDVGMTIRTAVGQPLELDGRTHSVRTSVGLAVSSGEVGAEELLRQADVALSRAKDLGRDRVEVYRPELDRRVQLRVAVRETLRKALAENRVEMVAQPIVELATGRTVSAEALVRLRDLDGTVLPPAAFIDVAEQSGLIRPLGMRVLDLALALCSRWHAQGKSLTIAVNASPRQLHDLDFPQTVATLLEVHSVPAHLLVLEVTESTVVDATGPVLHVLQTLRRTGVHVAIDDFGTGYSSLASLRDLPADIVKIDRSFVSGLGQDSGDEAIVRAVLAMAHATGRVVVAEGVETAAQAQRLAELNCDRVQGYWFSRPQAPIDFNPRRTFAWRENAEVDQLQTRRSTP